MRTAEPFLSVRTSLTAVLFLLLVVAACGGDKSGGPAGAPEDVVTRAPDVTLSARTARIRINSPNAAASGVVDLQAQDGRLAVTATGVPKPADLLISSGTGYVKSAGDPAYVKLDAAVPDVLRGGDPFANLDLVRGTVHILSDGGGEVDGASTLRYTLTIDPQQAISTTPAARRAGLRAVLQNRSAFFMADVWIDSALHIRRIEVPTDLTPTTPSTRPDRLPIASDVDYLAFGVPVGPIAAPTMTSSLPSGAEGG
jgi:hypothetical protein